jgi:hypothetical protein
MEILSPGFTTVLPACPTCLRASPSPCLREGWPQTGLGLPPPPPNIHLPQVCPLPIFSAATTQLPSPSAAIPCPVTFSPACLVVPPLPLPFRLRQGAPFPLWLGIPTSQEILPPAFTTVLPACPTCLRPPPPPAVGRDGLRPDWVGPNFPEYGF